MPAGDVVGLLEQRREPLAQLSEDVDPGMRPRRLGRLDLGQAVLLHAAQVTGLVAEHRCRVVRMGDGTVGLGQLGDGSGEQQASLVVALGRQPAEVHALVGEDVRLVAEDVVEAPEFVVQEAGRPCRREHEPRTEFVDVAQRAVELPLALGRAEGLLGPRRQLVDHGEPDGTGELHQVAVDRPERLEDVEFGRARVVLVQHGLLAVTDPQGRVADRAVGRRAERVDHDLQPVQVDDLTGGRRDEGGETALAQRVLEFARRVLGQQHRGLLRHVLLQVLDVEVVAVQV